MASLSYYPFFSFPIEPWTVFITIKVVPDTYLGIEKMEQTPITPTLLKDKGFVEDFRNGHLMFVKGNYAIAYFYAWIPLNINDSSITLMSNVYVNTWEEFEKLIEESKKVNCVLK